LRWIKCIGEHLKKNKNKNFQEYRAPCTAQRGENPESLNAFSIENIDSKRNNQGILELGINLCLGESRGIVAMNNTTLITYAVLPYCQVSNLLLTDIRRQSEYEHMSNSAKIIEPPVIYI
jgi:hypothetical protein